MTLLTILGIIGISELLILVLLPIFIIFFIALIDLLKNNFEGNNKIVWLLLVILVPFLGSILYFLIGRRQRLKK